MKNKKSVLILLSMITGIAIISLAAILIRKSLRSEQEIIAEQIIHSYMRANGMDIRPGTKEYKVFMRQIFWGDFPELAEIDSEYVKNQEELEYVMDYAWKYSGYKELYGGYQGPDIGEAEPPPTEPAK